jgi:hypothetical protein
MDEDDMLEEATQILKEIVLSPDKGGEYGPDFYRLLQRAAEFVNLTDKDIA